MSWLEKILPKTTKSSGRKEIPEGVWAKCTSCDSILYKAELEKSLNVCPKCDHHMRVSGRKRLEQFLDDGDRQELGAQHEPKDVLKFRDSKKYSDRINAAQKSSGEKDALVAMKGNLKGIPVAAVAFEF